MIPPHRLDIGLLDLTRAIIRSLRALLPRTAESDSCRRTRELGAIEQFWAPRGAVVGLSVRSLYDALLTAMNWPAGSEILLSAVTIADMATITREHGLIPVPVDLDPIKLSPTPEQVSRLLSDRTKGLLVVQLFGQRVSLAPLAAVTQPRGILLLEDGAQAFSGDSYRGDPAADVSLFSFGPIKRRTALGGGVAVVDDEQIRQRLEGILDQQPIQPTRDFLWRVLQFGSLSLAARPWVYSLVTAALRLGGAAPHQLMHRWTRSFPGGNLLPRLRQRPCQPMLELLRRRLHQDAHRDNQRRQETALAVSDRHRELFPTFCNPEHAYWLTPFILTGDNQRRVAFADRLRQHGLDTAARTTSLSLVPIPNVDADRAEQATTSRPLPVSQKLLEEILFLPSPDLWTQSAITQFRKLLEEALRDPAGDPA